MEPDFPELSLTSAIFSQLRFAPEQLRPRSYSLFDGKSATCSQTVGTYMLCYSADSDEPKLGVQVLVDNARPDQAMPMLSKEAAQELRLLVPPQLFNELEQELKEQDQKLEEQLEEKDQLEERVQQLEEQLEEKDQLEERVQQLEEQLEKKDQLEERVQQLEEQVQQLEEKNRK